MVMKDVAKAKAKEAEAEEVEEAATTAAHPQRPKACAHPLEIMFLTTTRRELWNE